MKSLKQSTVIIFWVLIGVFLFVIGQLCIPAVRNLFGGSELFLIPMGIFCLLGLALLVLALKEKAEGKIKKFLILTGASAIGLFVFVILHNLIYGLFIYFFGQDFWQRIGLNDEPVFFLLAIVVCPIGFLVGIIGTIVLFIRERGRN